MFDRQHTLAHIDPELLTEIQNENRVKKSILN